MNPSALGVTRVARVTGLDRTGVEVACAVRPEGHVLQVTNGKGETFAEARASALGEAAELFAAENPDSTRYVFASTREMLRRFGPERVFRIEELGSAGELTAPGLVTDTVRFAWVDGFDLWSEKEVWVPAQAVFCPPAGAAPLGPLVVGWTTNGLASHPDPVKAETHALLETLERDGLSRSAPEGFTPGLVKRRKLPAKWLVRGAPKAHRWGERLRAENFAVTFFDLRPAQRSSGLALAGAVLVDREGGAVALTAGYACRQSWDEACLAALFEAAQSRLTDIHGAREDVQHQDPAQAIAFSKFADPLPGVVPAPLAPRGSPREWLKRAGVKRGATVRLGVHAGVSVFKVVLPGFSVSGLL